MLAPQRLLILSLLCLATFAPSVQAQYKIDFQLCEEIKIDKTQISIQVIETATCTKPSNTFTPKGSLRNVFMVATFPPVPTGAALAFKITKNDADGEYVHMLYYTVTQHHKTAWAEATINLPGKYFVQMMNYYPPNQVWGTATFTVGEDKVGPRATGNIAAGGGKVEICKEVDDNWKCVEASNQWKANTPLNVFFENPVAAALISSASFFISRAQTEKTSSLLTSTSKTSAAKIESMRPWAISFACRRACILFT